MQLLFYKSSTFHYFMAGHDGWLIENTAILNCELLKTIVNLHCEKGLQDTCSFEDHLVDEIFLKNFQTLDPSSECMFYVPKRAQQVFLDILNSTTGDCLFCLDVKLEFVVLCSFVPPLAYLQWIYLPSYIKMLVCAAETHADLECLLKTVEPLPGWQDMLTLSQEFCGAVCASKGVTVISGVEVGLLQSCPQLVCIMQSWTCKHVLVTIPSDARDVVPPCFHHMLCPVVQADGTETHPVLTGLPVAMWCWNALAKLFPGHDPVDPDMQSFSCFNIVAIVDSYVTLECIKWACAANPYECVIRCTMPQTKAASFFPQHVTVAMPEVAHFIDFKSCQYADSLQALVCILKDSPGLGFCWKQKLYMTVSAVACFMQRKAPFTSSKCAYGLLQLGIRTENVTRVSLHQEEAQFAVCAGFRQDMLAAGRTSIMSHNPYGQCYRSVKDIEGAWTLTMTMLKSQYPGRSFINLPPLAQLIPLHGLDVVTILQPLSEPFEPEYCWPEKPCYVEPYHSSRLATAMHSTPEFSLNGFVLFDCPGMTQSILETREPWAMFVHPHFFRSTCMQAIADMYAAMGIAPQHSWTTWGASNDMNTLYGTPPQGYHSSVLLGMICASPLGSLLGKDGIHLAAAKPILKVDGPVFIPVRVTCRGWAVGTAQSGNAAHVYAIVRAAAIVL